MKKIHWRPIENFLLYWVSSDGRVRSFNLRQRILRPATDKEYLKVALWKDDNLRSVRVHRLVAKAFLRPVPGKNEVNHEDGVKSNNNHWNLKWSTRLENMQHADRLNLRTFASGEAHGMSKLSDEDISEIRSLIGAVSYRDILKRFKIGVSHYYRIKNNQTRTVKEKLQLIQLLS